MMNTTGTTVVHVLSGPTRQILRRSLRPGWFKRFLELAWLSLTSQFE
jgi:hypothetical protein